MTPILFKNSSKGKGPTHKRQDKDTEPFRVRTRPAVVVRHRPW